MSPRRTDTEHWAETDIPDLSGKAAVITGANSGLGFETARALATRGATVVLACRDPRKADDAATRIRGAVPGAAVSTLRLDLGSLDSVRDAAAQLRSTYSQLDLLINNAGLMMPPYGHTADGFELQFGTNHLGHFALTGLVLDLLLAAPGSRVVTVSSNGHRLGDIYFDDPNFAGRYRPVRAYGQSKLANLMFTYELQRRLDAAGRSTIALAAHPGTASTELERTLTFWMKIPARLMPRQGADRGALPTLRAATDPAARGGEYYGPGGRGEMTGDPVRVQSSDRSHDAAAQRRLWDLSEKLTGVSYGIDAASGQRAD